LAITRDDKYLLYVTGILFETDPIIGTGKTTFGIVKAEDLTAVTVPFTFSFNDALTPRHLMVDQLMFFPDNLLNTQNTSHEFMALGSTIQNANTAKFFILTGAFHSSNNTVDVLNRVYYQDYNAGNTAFNNKYRLNNDT
jgi:hypothetical protein